METLRSGTPEQPISTQQSSEGSFTAATDPRVDGEYAETGKRKEAFNTNRRASDSDLLSSHAIVVSEIESEWHIEPALSTKENKQVSAMVTNVKGCIIDISRRTSNEVYVAKAHVFTAHQSLIICGHISGSTFLSESENCVIVATTRQLRLHNCKNCVIYLHCTSKPVIEGCKGIKFAPIPAILVSAVRNY